MNAQIPKAVINIMGYLEKTKDLQKDIVETINKHSPTLTEGVVTLLIIAAGHLKDSNMNKIDFLTLCETVFDGAGVPNDDTYKNEAAN